VLGVLCTCFARSEVNSPCSGLGDACGDSSSAVACVAPAGSSDILRLLDDDSAGSSEYLCSTGDVVSAGSS
jgi:hypothetical protein